MKDKIYFVRLTKVNDDIEFHVNEGVVTEITEEYVTGYTIDPRVDNGKQEWNIKAGKMEKVLHNPFGQNVNSIRFHAYSLDEENLNKLQESMLNEMNAEMDKYQAEVERAKQCVVDFREKLLRNNLVLDSLS